MPSREEEWLQVVHMINNKWQFPLCIGALDGRHCALQAPTYSSREYFNYKQYCIVVLMGLLFADFGAQDIRW